MKKFILSLFLCGTVLLFPASAQDFLHRLTAGAVFDVNVTNGNASDAGHDVEMSPGESLFGKNMTVGAGSMARIPESLGSSGAKYYGFSNNKLYDFNIIPLALDSLDMDRAYSTYGSVDVRGRIYSFYPVWTDGENYASSVTAVDVYVLDANTFEVIEQYRTDWKMVPSLSTFDETTGLIYTLAYRYDNGDRFYLSIVDPVEKKLKVISYLGKYKIGESGNRLFQGLIAIDGTLLGLVDDQWVTFDKYNGSMTVLKPMGLPRASDQKVMVRNPIDGLVYWQVFNYVEGNSFYRFDPNLAWGGNGPKDIEFVTKIEGNGRFNNIFYKDEANYGERESRLTDITDFEVAGPDADGKATISFTIPSVTTKGIELAPDGKAKPYCMYFLDGVHKFTASIYNGRKFGEKVSFDVVIPEGLHSVSVEVGANKVDPATQGVIKPTTTVGRMVHVGYAAPAAVGNPCLNISDNAATITWTAPTEPMYADFGAAFDADDITYKVIRDLDGAVIADGITATQAIDENMPEVLSGYTYTVIPMSHGMEGVAAKTNAVVHGQYVPLPFSDDFKTEPVLYTIYNLDQNGTDYQWQWNNVYELMSNKSSTSFSGSFYPCNDWLITPSFKLRKGLVYELAFDVRGGSFVEEFYSNLKVTMGRGTDWRDQTTVLEDYSHFRLADFENRKIYFTVPEDGVYNIGFYDYTAPQQLNILLDNLSLREYASASVPDKITDIAWTPAENGELRGTLRFTLPAASVSGETLTELSRVVISSGDKELAILKNQTPGAVKTITVSTEAGPNDITLAAYNGDGMGIPVTFSVFCGADKPAAVTNLKATWRMTSQNAVLLSWNAPSQAGANGGYTDPQAITYNVYKYNVQSKKFELYRSDITSTSVSITENTAGSQMQYIYGVAASSPAGTGLGAITYVTLGLPYSLPFTESYASNGFKTYPWYTEMEADAADWIIADDTTDPVVKSQDGDNGLLMLPNPVGCQDVTTTVYSPIVDLSKGNPVLSFWLYHGNNVPASSYVEVLASKNGADFTPLSGSKTTMSDNAGWVRHTYPLSSLKGNSRVQIALRGHSETTESRIYLDRFVIADAPDTDLATVAVFDDNNGYAVAGNQIELYATVANEGTKDVDGFTVTLYKGDTEIAKKPVTGVIAPADTVVVGFKVNLNAAEDKAGYTAVVTAAGDMNKDNDRSDAHTITRTDIALNPANDFTGYIDDNRIQLDWEAPAPMTDGLTMVETFENSALWSLDGFNGWSTFDADGQRTTAISLASRNRPGYAAPMAYMVWTSPLNYSSGYDAYAGRKCLISWVSNGLKADGTWADGGREAVTNDDWLVSPEILGGSTLSFMARSVYGSHNGPESFEILVSSSDRQPSSFVLLKSDKVGAGSDDWTGFSYTLPADARYVAIRHTKGSMAFMIDNITYTVPLQPRLLGYNVYCDDNVYASPEMTSLLTEAGISYGKWAVSAVYDIGESVLTRTLDFGASSVEMPKAGNGGFKAVGGRGSVRLSSDAPVRVDISGVSGVRFGSYMVSGATSVSLPSGVYIVKHGNNVEKISVK